MHTKSKLLVALGTAALAVCPALNAQAPANTLVAAKAASAPTLDGNASDPAWAAAQPLTFKVFGGANFGGTGETTVTLKAVTSGDVHVAYRWDNGRWTYEVARKLATGSKYDVQFDDPNRAYYFGFAAFDNAQVRHAMGGDALKLVFAKQAQPRHAGSECRPTLAHRSRTHDNRRGARAWRVCPGKTNAMNRRDRPDAQVGQP